MAQRRKGMLWMQSPDLVRPIAKYTSLQSSSVGASRPKPWRMCRQFSVLPVQLEKGGHSLLEIIYLEGAIGRRRWRDVRPCARARADSSLALRRSRLFGANGYPRRRRATGADRARQRIFVTPFAAFAWTSVPSRAAPRTKLAEIFRRLSFESTVGCARYFLC